MQWEYQVVPMSHPELSAKDTGEILNKLGRDGWELTAMVPGDGADQKWSMAILKRPNPKPLP
jgi:hypothetical protein